MTAQTPGDPMQSSIESSILLKPELKEQLLTLLPRLSGDQRKTIEGILQQEASLLAEATKKAIERDAKEKQDASILSKLDAFFAHAKKALRMAQEQDSRAEEALTFSDLSQKPS